MGNGHLEHLLVADSNKGVESKDQGIVTAPPHNFWSQVSILSAPRENPFCVVTMLPVIGPRDGEDKGCCKPRS